MTHSRIVVQKGRELYHKDCLPDEDLVVEVEASTLDKEDFCAACDDPLVVEVPDDVQEVLDSDDDDDDDTDDKGNR